MGMVLPSRCGHRHAYHTHKQNEGGISSHTSPATPLQSPMSLRACLLQGSGGEERLLVFGGRQHSGGLLNDAWAATLQWPEVRWRQVAPAQPHQDAAPRPRRGHSAVLLDDAPTPQIVRQGGGCLNTRVAVCTKGTLANMLHARPLD